MKKVKTIEECMFIDCDICNDEMYFFTERKPAFCKMNMHTFDISYIESFDAQRCEISKHKSNMIQSVGDKIYSLDIRGKYLLVYDSIKDIYENIEIDCNYEAFGNFLSLNRVENTIFVFTSKQNILVKLECETGKVSKKRIIKDKGNILPLVCSCQVGEDIYLFQENSSDVIVYNTGNDSISIIMLGEQNIGCKDVKYYNNHLYILGKNNAIILLDITEKKIKKIRNQMTDEKEGSMLFLTDKYIWILPSRGNDIVRFDLNTKEEYLYDEYPSDFAYHVPSEWKKYTHFCESEEYYYLAMRSSDYMLSISKAGGEIKWIKPNLPTESARLKRGIIINNGILPEENFSLSFYVKSICEGIL